ncbi:O-antigen ligase family protein [Candidatus Gracilibacteria bacterium]|nr:O-antigen ligase family protein [Candidatus Gracilibacteria bacterium]
MKIFFWCCLALLIPGLLLRIPVGGAGILATDIILPVFAFVWLFTKLVITRNFPRNSFIRPGIIFLVIALISFVLGTSELLFKEQVLSLAHLLRFASLLIWGWASTDIFRNEQNSFWKGLFWILTIIVLLGLVQFRFIPDISSWSREGGLDPHTGRLLGTWLDPNFMAGLLGFSLPLLIARWYRSSSTRMKIILGVLIALFLYALFLTFSRSGYLASCIGLLVFFLFRDWKIIIFGILIIALGIATNERAQKRVGELGGTLSAIVLHETDEIDPTASLRLQSWQKSFELWQKYPLLGIGYNTYRYRASEEGIVDENYFSSGGSDSTHLTILVTTGILGFLAFMWFLGKIVWINFHRFLSTRNELFLGFVAGLVTIFIHAFFVNSLLFPLIFMPLIATAGILENMKSGKN